VKATAGGDELVTADGTNMIQITYDQVTSVTVAVIA